ncbi:MAG: DUF5330 domain-containing protein [Hyphomicrobiales bacterium]
MRLFRTIFLLGALAALLPSPPEDHDTTAVAAREVTAPEVISFASRTASDLGGFCGRQPMACETAGFIAAKLEAKATYGARLVYAWAEGTSGPGQRIEARLSTASPPLLASSAAERPQNTLTMEDLIPEWRDPRRPRKS